MNRRTMMTTLAGGVVAVRIRRPRERGARRLTASCRSPARRRRRISRARKNCPIRTPTTRSCFPSAAKVKDDEVHPTLKMIGLYLNTLAHNGVPAKNRHIAAMFHQGGGDAVFSNEVYKARHNGVDNPNIAVLKELHEAGVELRVCGQGLMGKKVEPSQLLPGVEADLWAMVTMVNLQSRGYVRVG